MILAVVVGTVVATVRIDNIEGATYLAVQPCDPEGCAVGEFIVALDILGAAPDEIVLVSQGSSVRQTEATRDKPVDALIIGIVDMVDQKNVVRDFGS